jgi:hypothetical protein
MKYYLISFLLIISFINPWVEELMFHDPLPYMLSHYSLFTAGVLISYKRIKPYNIILNIIVGSLLVILWHTPLLFSLGASNLVYRIIDEFCIILSGIIIGSTIPYLRFNYKMLLLALWMLGDTYLSIIFMAFPEQYSIYYKASEFYITGIVMFVIMNAVSVYLIILYFSKLLSS